MEFSDVMMVFCVFFICDDYGVSSLFMSISKGR